MSPRAWRHRIEDILQAIRKIREYTRDLTLQDLANDDKTVDAVIRNFIVIGEAARHVPEEISTRHSSIPWRLMADMRNFAVHELFRRESHDHLGMRATRSPAAGTAA